MSNQSSGFRKLGLFLSSHPGEATTLNGKKTGTTSRRREEAAASVYLQGEAAKERR
jgi:hypothetical protein